MNIDSDLTIDQAIDRINQLFPNQMKHINHILCFKHHKEHLDIHLSNGVLNVKYMHKKDIFFALKEAMIHENLNLAIKPHMKQLEFMVDCARGAVPKIQTLKDLVVYLALLGYTHLGLYIEDLMILPNEPMFGYMRGQYSKEEIIELVDFAKDYGIVIKPYIQTLAHLSHIFKHQVYKEICDTADILLVGHNKTYDLIEKMIIYAKDIFQTNEINIGMDEAWQLGLGKYLTNHGYHNRLDIMIKHMNKVHDICVKHHMDASMWADMFFLLKNGTYLSDEQTNFDDIKKHVPQDIKLIYWDYYQVDKQKYLNKMKDLKTLSSSIGYAGGAWKWIGYTPLNQFSIDAMKQSFEACISEKINHYILTAWGDDGAEASVFSVLPTLVSISNLNYKSNSDHVKDLKMLTNYTLDEWFALDRLNQLYASNDHRPVNPSKYLLFEDVLMGHPNIYVSPDYKNKYQMIKNELKPLLNRTSNFSYIFKTLYDLCDVLTDKATLSLEIYQAYKLNQDYKPYIIRINQVINKLDNFKHSFYKQWHLENKPFGYEVHSYRLGGLNQRLKDIQHMLENEKDNVNYLLAHRILTPNTNHHLEGCKYFNRFREMMTF